MADEDNSKTYTRKESTKLYILIYIEVELNFERTQF